jgi:hypothetical protein
VRWQWPLLPISFRSPSACSSAPSTSSNAGSRRGQGRRWPHPNAAPGRQAMLTKWECSSRVGVLAPRSVASHGLRPHTVVQPSHHCPPLLQPSSTTSCSPNKSARPTLLLRPSLACSSGGSLPAALQAARASWRRQETKGVEPCNRSSGCLQRWVPSLPPLGRRFARRWPGAGQLQR